MQRVQSNFTKRFLMPSSLCACRAEQQNHARRIENRRLHGFYCGHDDRQISAVSTPANFVPQYLHLYVDDVDSTFKRAVEAGATVDMPLEDQFWGDRYGKITIRSASSGASPATSKMCHRMK